MRTSFYNLWMIAAIVFLTAGSFAHGQDASKTNANSASAFDENSVTGKDPFFPRSKRKAKAAVAVDPSKAAETPVVAPIALLSLKGISGSSRKLALINNQTFARGETSTVKTTNGNMRVKCVEIKDKSVVVQINDDPRNQVLYLKEGF
ncbi:MAG: hypothetical protein JWN25_2398 [Verrucomicrobiales bacterium]|nr:hypothetical protein [Verrucomicrobiales bacterium]MDB6128970.1 hypothetical protein [Verrucomicrobiales bacterium]